MVLRLFVYIALAFAAITTYANADVKYYNNDGFEYLIFDGAIEKDEFHRFAYVLADLESKGVKLNGMTLFLHSGGGLVNEAEDMAKLIRETGLVTTLYAKDRCASACTILFAAGVERVMQEGAYLGFHPAAIYKWDGDIGLQTALEWGQYFGVAEVVTYLKYIGWDKAQAFVTFLMGVHATTPASEMFWIDGKQAAEVGFVTKVIGFDRPQEEVQPNTGGGYLN